MATVYLGLGTNLGERERNMRVALEIIEERIGPILSSSSLYETAPWGYASENLFMNMAVKVETCLLPLPLLHKIKGIESEMGRTKASGQEGYRDRVIDIDILFYDELVMESEELTIPHPYISRRLFVLEPLDEIAPELVHPVSHKTINELKSDLQCSEKQK